jgi:hypothetical protein
MATIQGATRCHSVAYPRESSFILVDVLVKAQLLFVQLWTAILSGPVGATILKHFFCPLIEPILLLHYGIWRRIVGPWIQKYLPSYFLTFLRDYYLPAIYRVVFENPFISVTIKELANLLLLAYTYNSEHAADMYLFLRMDLDTTVRLGSGTLSHLDNCFFPTALSRGPSGKIFLPMTPTSFRDDHLWASINNIRLAQTLLYMCILTYHPTLIKPSLQAGMFPGTCHYSCSQNVVHVFCHGSWAVVVIHQTELFRLGLGNSVKSLSRKSTTAPAVSLNYYNTMLALGNRLLRDGHQPAGRSTGSRGMATQSSTSLFNFLEYLTSQGVKLYATGHSAGGALASLLSLHMKATRNISMTAVATFGAPPVAANEAFRDYYTKNVPVSWKFVNRHEIGSMVPPLPFVSSTRFMHVGQRIDVQTINNGGDHLALSSIPHSKDLIQPEFVSAEYLDALAETEQLPSMLLDHNPVVTLRHLRNALTELNHEQRDRLIKSKVTLHDMDSTSGSDSGSYYSAHQSSLNDE